MTWRSFLAIILSMLILFLWPVIAKKVFHYPIEPQEVRNVTNISVAPQKITQPTQIAQPREIAITNKLEPKPLGNISKFLLKILTFLYNLLHNWGLAIIALSVLIWLVFSPLTIRSMRAMKRMQDLQPKIEQLRQACGNNTQKLNKEILQLYREEKVNPFGGCLPMLLQIPIFIGLYQMLMRLDVLKGANFLWIKDLSKPDKTLVLNNFPVNILPVATALVMFWQQKQTLKAASGAQAEQQKIMSIIFPIMFGFIFYPMPSGLVLYWLVNSLLMCVNQWQITKIKA